MRGMSVEDGSGRPVARAGSAALPRGSAATRRARDVRRRRGHSHRPMTSRSSRPWISSRRSSTIHTRSAGSPPRMRCRMSTPWAASRSPRSTSWRSPPDRLPSSVLTEILRGGHDTVHEAGAVMVGGHTVIDEELKYGLAVTGRVDPGRMLTNAAARPGDRLVLTKPLGNGLVATALKQGKLSGDVAAPRERRDAAVHAAAESRCEPGRGRPGRPLRDRRDGIRTRSATPRTSRGPAG